MSKPVYITADSTCDLTPALLERFHVKTIPLHIVLGEENYLDGVDFTQEMIYERYAKDKVLPRTAAVSPQEFTDFFTPLVEAGYEVVFLSISSGLSGTYQNAVIAAQDLPGVYPVDSLQLTTGMGEMVLAACEMRDEGKDAASIAQAMQDLIGRVNVSFVIDEGKKGGPQVHFYHHFQRAHTGAGSTVGERGSQSGPRGAGDLFHPDGLYGNLSLRTWHHGGSFPGGLRTAFTLLLLFC